MEKSARVEMKNILTAMAISLALGTMGCEIRTYPEHGPVFHIVEKEPGSTPGTIIYSPDLYEFENQFGEYCYGERDYGLHGTCYTEYCYETWFDTGWYHWDTYCI